MTVKEVPPIKDWIGGRFSTKQIREVSIEDLLGRDPIWLDMEGVASGLKDTVVLVTGAAGSIGSEIVRQLMSFDCRKVILLDQAESALYDLQNELLKSYRASRFEAVIASVIDRYRMHQVFETFKPQYVFNAAAYKHVPMMEDAPYQAVRVNIGGTALLADLSVESGVKKFVMISTDKAVNPTNVMGASKRICEIYVQALAQSGLTKTQFITTRFGNVLGSNGSVVPLFRKQIAEGGPVTVTHPEIIRYFMTIPEACQLVLEAGFMGKGGEIYVFDMGDPVKIYDLAVKMIILAGLKPDVDIPIVFTGLRPGEKLYEEPLADEENTVKTHHPKIKTAKGRSHDFTIVKMEVDELLKAIQTEPETQLVQLMKKLVPEYISQNSKYCQFDEVTV
ncbi:MAG: UDP-N-acetylglucosamine 4,6-dehydratase family protein [Mangrovibacterium sp.]